MQEHKVEIDLDGKTLSLESGWLAKQANGCVVVRYGDTMVLVSATMAKSAREGIDFFPSETGSTARRSGNPDLPID